ncbi:hypothetical protein SDC9_61526 [bioreactor metagenome]|uniref:N-acetyltransferase domain-containing protein n=1 Tax=bioreactor metagenome TaxID=1076179 RepID=A0A644XFZ3_9ZZZZ
MILEKFDIKLRSLSQCDLEMVRTARNSDFIRNRMIYREIISPEMQQHWYNSLDPANDIYLIVEHNEKPRGLINIRNIRYDHDENESGVFFWDNEALQSHLPVITSWLAGEAGYHLLGGQQTTVQVLKSNKQAFEFNQSIGFQIISETEHLYIMQQTKESFSQSTLDGRNRYLAQTGGDKLLKLSFGDHPQDDFRQSGLLNFHQIIKVSPVRQIDRVFWYNVDF